tara:strand:- start:2314 stop:3831 length:1518 start_codon:yes stop_codon:yes gene_type:complete
MTDERSIVIRGGRVLDSGRPTADFADLLIMGGSIEDVGSPGLTAPDDALLIDASDKLLHPGLINAHTHGYHAAHKATTDRWTLERFLTTSPWVNAELSLQGSYLSTKIAAAEMVLKGCTACYDLPLPLPMPSLEAFQAVAQAYSDVGMRAVIAPMAADTSIFLALPGFMDALPRNFRSDLESRGASPAEAIIARYGDLLRDWSADGDRDGDDLVQLAVSPAIAHHCSDALFKGLAALANEAGVGLHTHLAESKVQAVAGVKRFGKTLTAHLDGLGVLGANVTVAHGVWLDRDDIGRLSDHGASLAHNPGSNMRLGNGIADVRTMLDVGLNVGIGTDGARASDHQNMYEAMRLTDLISRARGPDADDGLTSAQAFHAATLGSARSLGLDDVGRLEPGYKADIVFLDLTSINWTPMNDPVLQIVHVEDGTGVDSVMIGGRMVVEAGKPTNVDLAALAAEAERLQPRFADLLADNEEMLEQIGKVAGDFCGALAAEPYHVDRFGVHLS